MSIADFMLWAILVPFAGAILISQLGRWPNLREAASLITATFLIVVIATIYQRFQEGEPGRLVLAEPIPGISIAFSVEPLGMLFAIIASSLWLVTTIYAIGYMRGHHEKNQTRFFTTFAVAIAGTMGIIFADNLFTLFIFYEFLTISTYPLVVHAGSEKARRNGRVYLGILMATSIGLMLPAMIVIWANTGTLEFSSGGIIAEKIDPAWVLPLYLLFIFGIGKAAVMPLHRWLPAAMVAPTPVSALLHAVAVVKAGVFSILKVTIYIFGPDVIIDNGVNEWIIWLPAITILLASLIAMTRDNLKERLAYSTISQLSYIVLGAVLANQMGLLGGSLHIAMHAFAKITLFFAAGAILVATHKTEVSQLNGLGYQMPFTFIFFAIGAASIIGLPPLGGMWSKWYLALGTVEAEQWALLGVLMISSLLNIAYLLVIPVRAFFVKPGQTVSEGIKEAPVTCLIGMLIPSLMCIYLFFHPEPFYSLAQTVSR
ncbi:MAG: monovalent cation/H+ antiporter subunit D family protein [Gammaproteobacteria bacterium]|nr:MAG: monovalent cation/H+ antiporter subunit D family protein [Gammaproteobacteria bacterium]